MLWTGSTHARSTVQAALAALLLLACVATASAAPPNGAPPSTPPEGDGVKQNRQITLLAFGDSLTAGYGVPADAALPALLEDMLRADGYNVRIVNAGVSGDTSAGGLARLPWLLEEGPDCAWIELGANDGLMGRDPAAMEANLDTILAMFERRGIPVLFVGMRAIANYGQEYTRAYESVFPRLAQKHNVLFYPFLLKGVVMDQSLNQLDGIHPNEEGTRVIAANIYPMVRELVERAIAN